MHLKAWEMASEDRPLITCESNKAVGIDDQYGMFICLNLSENL